jgi:hypothetical protein
LDACVKPTIAKVAKCFRQEGAFAAGWFEDLQRAGIAAVVQQRPEGLLDNVAHHRRRREKDAGSPPLCPTLLLADV